MAELETTNVETNTDVPENITEPTEATESEEIARLKAEIARQKSALDKATREAAANKRALRAKQSAEEAAAEEAKETAQRQAEELEYLRKQVAVSGMAKSVMAFVSDEAVATEIAGGLYGAEEPESVIDLFKREWTKREKALRLEYGKIPAPGAGTSDGPTVTMEQLNAMTVLQRAQYAAEHPEDYNKLMGR